MVTPAKKRATQASLSVHRAPSKEFHLYGLHPTTALRGWLGTVILFVPTLQEKIGGKKDFKCAQGHEWLRRERQRTTDSEISPGERDAERAAACSSVSSVWCPATCLASFLRDTPNPPVSNKFSFCSSQLDWVLLTACKQSLTQYPGIRRGNHFPAGGCWLLELCYVNQLEKYVRDVLILFLLEFTQ